MTELGRGKKGKHWSDRAWKRKKGKHWRVTELGRGNRNEKRWEWEQKGDTAVDGR